jgi:DNA polymerase V
MYALVDCNNFYVSCERIFQPHLIGKPVVVLSNNDGCAVSRSNEAKALGIKMAGPIFMQKELVKKHNIVCLSSNYTLYGDISRRVMSLFDRWTPDVEIYSIDEAFLKFGPRDIPRLPAIAEEMRSIIHQWTGIPVSVGIGATKTLAKAASVLAKRGAGFFVLDNPEHLKQVPVGKVWGVGHKYSEWLIENDVHTAFDLRNSNEQWIKKRMSIVGHRMVLELRGQPCIDLEHTPPARKNMAYARTFGKLLESKDEMAESVTHYAERIAAKLRKHKLAAQNIVVFLETNPFRGQDRQYRAQANMPFPVPTSYTPELVGKAMELFERIYRPGFKYKKAGVLLLELVPESQVQGQLFDVVDRFKSKNLMSALDGINARHGRDTLGYAGAHVRKGWKPRFEKRTERFTTQWDELPQVAA